MLTGASGVYYDTVRQIAWSPGSYTREVLQEMEDMETRRESKEEKLDLAMKPKERQRGRLEICQYMVD